MTAAAGMAMGGLRPVVAVYSTFFTRAFDQAYYDVGLHRLPVTIVLDRAGITGDDGASHHGVLDMSLALSIPNMTVFAPSCTEEVSVMLNTALSLDGPATIRFPKTPPVSLDGQTGAGLNARKLRQGSSKVCVLGVGKMTARCAQAALALMAEGIDVTLWDTRIVSPADPDMLDDALAHEVVITVEDGVRIGGAGTHLRDALAQRAMARGVTCPQSESLGVPKRYLAQAAPESILAGLGLDADGITQSIRGLLKAAPVTQEPR